MSDAAELLARLADVHEPAAPAAGTPWLIVLNIALALAWLGLLMSIRHRRRTAWRREALARLDTIRSAPPESRIADLATLLRQVVRRQAGDHVATLTGEDWLAALDACFGGDWFRHGDGQVFGDALYRGCTADHLDIESLSRAIERRLRRLPSRPRSNRAPVESMA